MDFSIPRSARATRQAPSGCSTPESGGRRQARLGEVVDVLALPGFVALQGAQILGVATFRVTDERVEVAAIMVTERCRHTGVGSALLEAVIAAVSQAGARQVWLVTTNDNIDALRFYPRRAGGTGRLSCCVKH